jgi:hypothetical protein
MRYVDYKTWRDVLILAYMAGGLRDWPLNSIAYKINCVGPDSSVGLAIRYGLEGRRSNPGGGQIFLARP